ncbi:MAG: pentapeptide repeat-containing protein [Xenococcus sp. MO_188.B8]|nr:pentapeptide repeat-containing protein [Xenococcus sp. MO_188.B8]
MKASEVLRRYAAGERNFSDVDLRGQSLEGQDLSEADFSGADFSQTNIRSTNFTNAILTGTTFRESKAGLQQSWAISLVIISITISILSGLASGLAGIFPSGTLGPNFIQRHGSIFPGLITYLILAIFFIGIKKQGFTPALVIIAGVIAGILAIALALTWVFDVTENLEGTGTVVRAVAGVLSVTAVLTGSGAGFGALAFTLAEISGGAEVRTFAQTLAVILTGSTTVVLAKELSRDLFLAGVLAGAILWLSFYISERVLVEDSKFGVIRLIAIAFAATGGTSFRGANLTDADFTQATLKSTDFREATLIRSCWHNAKKLDLVRPGITYLSNQKLRQLVITCEGQNENFDRLDLRGVNLQEANLENASFIDADFYQANLQGANLSRTKLVRANFERADLRNANFTGSCIQDWVITESTKLNGIICDYVYLRWVNGDKRDQMPPRGKFISGGFVTFVRYILETVELYHEKDINPRLALTVLQQMSRDYDEPLDIVALGKKGERVCIQVKVSENIARENFKDDYYYRYDTDLKLWSGNIHQLPPVVNSFIEKRISEIASEKTDDFVFVDATYVEGNYTEIYQGEVNMSGDRNINAETYYEQSGKLGIGHVSGGQFKDNVKITAEINEAEQQNLADAATEIQQLLEQLSKTNPTSTNKEKMVVVGEAVDRIENNPTLKTKVINALKAGGTEAFKEAIDHPLVNILVATIEGWQDAE